jgi:lysophospholipase L1-like esterase
MDAQHIKNKIKRFLANILLSVLSLTLTLIVLEVSFRVYKISSQNNVKIAWSPPEDYWNQYDPVLGWRHIPNKIVQHAYRDIPVVINTQGVRAEKDYDLKSRKILAVGCSFTFGHGVAGKDAWPQKLNDKLKSDGFDYDVINMGVCAYGLDQQYLWFLDKREEFKPDIVILGLLTNTLDRVIKYRWITGQGKPRYKVVMNKLILTNVPVPRRVLPGNTYRNWESILFDSNKSYFADFIMKRLAFKIPLNTKSEERLQITEKILQAFAERCKENNSKFLVVLIFPEENVVRLLIKNKIDFVDCSKSLIGKKGVFLEHDGHPSSYGHELIAEQVDKFLLENRKKYLLH